MKIIFRIIILSLILLSCTNKDEDVKYFNHDIEVVAVFTPRGIGDQSNTTGLIYKGLMRTTDSLGLSCRIIVPFTFEEGADSIIQLVNKNQSGRKQLIISTDPEYSYYLREKAIEGNIIDTDSTKLMVIDGGFVHPNIYTVHVPYYGMMYMAGYIASQMSDVDSIRIYIANENYLYLQEGKNGFIDGFTSNRANTIDVNNLSIDSIDNISGFLSRDLAYTQYAPECNNRFDMVLPLCGETIMGFLRYNRDFPESFYTIGIGTDMSFYSSDVPFSCVEHLDRVISTCIVEWHNNQLEHYRKFGLDEGWVDVVVSEKYKSQLEDFAQEIHSQAIEMEENYAK